MIVTARRPWRSTFAASEDHNSRVTDTDLACAAALHDAVEDHAPGLAPDGIRQAAFTALPAQFGARAAELVAAVTHVVYQPGRDEQEQYREYVIASLQASPWARVIKVSDFTDNVVGLFHTTGPKRKCALRPAAFSPRSAANLGS